MPIHCDLHHDLTRIRRDPASLANVHALALQIRGNAEDPALVYSLADRMLGHIHGLLEALAEDVPDQARRA